MCITTFYDNQHHIMIIINITSYDNTGSLF